MKCVPITENSRKKNVTSHFNKTMEIRQETNDVGRDLIRYPKEIH